MVHHRPRDGLRERLRANGFPVVLEVTPPRRPQPGVLLRRARLLGDVADAVNVIQRPGRVPSLDACRMLRSAGVEPIWNLVSRGRTRAEIEGDLARAAAAGIRAVLCVRGDHAADDGPDTPRVRDVVARAREALPEAAVGATLNPYAPRGPVLRNLLAKLRRGASFVQTQPVLDAGPLQPFAEEVRARFPAARILPMVMPLFSRERAEHMQRRLRIPVPPSLLSRLERRGEAAGWEALEETLAALSESPLADGIALMTARMDTPPDVGLRLAELVERFAGSHRGRAGPASGG